MGRIGEALLAYTEENEIDDIVAELRNEFKTEVPSVEIGERVLLKLKDLDKVAYVRFASVYRNFQDIDEFEAHLLESLRVDPKSRWGVRPVHLVALVLALGTTAFAALGTILAAIAFGTRTSCPPIPRPAIAWRSPPSSVHNQALLSLVKTTTRLSMGAGVWVGVPVGTAVATGVCVAVSVIVVSVESATVA